jgi:RNA polymerase sigma-70 factor, ECF subfamily
MRPGGALTRDDHHGGQSDAAAGLGHAALAARIQAGDRAAEGELVARFSRGLLLMLRHLARDPALADDLHQETLALVIEKIRGGELHAPERLAGFIRSVARNLFIADRRKAGRYAPFASGDDEAAAGPRAETLADRAPAPLDRALAAEEARRVRQLLAELRFDRDRQLLIRFYLSDASKEEICDDLDIAPERFNQLLHRARERLREIWERADKRQRFFSGVRRFVGSPGADPAPGSQRARTP